MKTQISQKFETKKEVVSNAPQKPGVYMASRLIRKTDRIDSNGNVIDPITKRIIRKNE